MKSILVTPKSKKEYEFILEFLKRMDVKISQMTPEQMEDFGMTYLLKDGPGKRVSESKIKKILEA